MGARGPLRKPDEIRQDRHADRHTDLQVIRPSSAVAIAPPPPPRGLLKSTRDAWMVFWTSPVATAVNRESDMPQLIRWAKALDEIARVEPVFRKRRIVTGSQGQPVLNPLGDWMAKQHGIAAEVEANFGMNPAKRARLGLTTAEAKLTAAQLNEMLERRDRVRDANDSPDEWEGEFTDA